MPTYKQQAVKTTLGFYLRPNKSKYIVMYLSNPSVQAEFATKWILKQRLTGSNSAFFLDQLP